MKQELSYVLLVMVLVTFFVSPAAAMVRPIGLPRRHNPVAIALINEAELSGPTIFVLYKGIGTELEFNDATDDELWYKVYNVHLGERSILVSDFLPGNTYTMVVQQSVNVSSGKRPYGALIRIFIGSGADLLCMEKYARNLMADWSKWCVVAEIKIPRTRRN